MTRNRKPSPSTLNILDCLTRSSEGLHGYALMKASGLASGTLYPILARLADRGWLTKQWETDPDAKGPPRRIYTLTPVGRAQLRDVSTKSEPKSVPQSVVLLQGGTA